jgi:hypothetical protein
MILALAIGLVLMISLYNVLNMQVYQSQAGRMIQQEATLAHHIFARMSRDILANMGPVPVVPPSSNASTANAGGTGASQAGTTTPATTTGAAATSGTTTTTTTDTSNTITFNSGVYGTNNLIILSTTKVPFSMDPTKAFSVDPTQQATTSDLRRVSYWLATGNQSGLAYQELMAATSNDLGTFPTDMSADSYTILAPEVKDIQFQYFDGVNWQDSWDGTTLGGPTGDIPIGPPSAIKITLTLNRKAPDNTDLTDDQLPKYTHVIAIPGGNNFPQTNPS